MPDLTDEASAEATTNLCKQLQGTALRDAKEGDTPRLPKYEPLEEFIVKKHKKHLPKRNEIMRPRRNLHTNVHSHVTHKSPGVETTQVAIDGRDGRRTDSEMWPVPALGAPRLCEGTHRRHAR